MYGFILGFRHVPIKLASVQAIYRDSVLDRYFAVQLNIDLCQSVRRTSLGNVMTCRLSHRNGGKVGK